MSVYIIKWAITILILAQKLLQYAKKYITKKLSINSSNKHDVVCIILVLLV